MTRRVVHRQLVRLVSQVRVVRLVSQIRPQARVTGFAGLKSRLRLHAASTRHSSYGSAHNELRSQCAYSAPHCCVGHFQCGVLTIDIDPATSPKTTTAISSSYLDSLLYIFYIFFIYFYSFYIVFIQFIQFLYFLQETFVNERQPTTENMTEDLLTYQQIFRVWRKQ